MKKYRFSLFLFTIILLHCTDSPHVSYGIKKFPNSLDPSFDLEFDESQISSQIYENLINLDNDCRTLIPGLAISWSISEDNLTYTFVLRKNVFFHDGTKLSSYSILSSFKWLHRKPKKSDIYKKIKRVDLIDSLTFQFVLKKPYSIFLHTLASPESFQVISEHAISKYDTLLGRHPVGTGPYELKKWINDDKIVLKRFKKYWGKQSKITEILFKYFHNKFQAEEALRDNIIDILYAPSSYSLDRLKWTGHIDYKTFTPQSILLIGFNNKVYPFNNKLVRKAILQAIDIPKIVHNSSRGNAIVAKGPVPPNFFNYGQMKQDQYNLDKAKSILHQQGINNLDVNFDFPLVALTRIVRIEFL